MRNQSARSATTSPSIGVVLVNWNGGGYTIPCIESLRAGTITPDRIVVVDNASRDGSPDRIADRFPEVELVRNSENLGFTGANNIGISKLLEQGCGYIWILNNDTVVHAGCLAALKAYMDAHPEAAACSGKILYASPEDAIWFAGSSYNRWLVRTSHRGLDVTDRGQYDSSEPVPFLSGCCMLIRRSAVERIGMFDDHFFAYGEDADWCLRAGEEGLQLVYVPQAIIWHKVNATVNKLKEAGTAGQTSPFSVYVSNRNKLYLIRKHARTVMQRVTAYTAYAASTCWYGGMLLVLGRMDKARALMLSVYDGMANPLASSSRNEIVQPRYLH